jgi:GST-like protein
MPAIIDPDGPDGKPISIFESGAILQYLGRKTGKFYPKEERARVEVEQWLYWQMANLGPNCGQAHHFRNYAPEKIAYGIDRYTNEVNRLYGVMDTRLQDRRFWPATIRSPTWRAIRGCGPTRTRARTSPSSPTSRSGIQRMHDRPAVAKAVKIGEELRANYNLRPTRTRSRCCSASAPQVAARTRAVLAVAELR